jgi:hypothetical protein
MQEDEGHLFRIGEEEKETHTENAKLQKGSPEHNRMKLVL